MQPPRQHTRAQAESQRSVRHSQHNTPATGFADDSRLVGGSRTTLSRDDEALCLPPFIRLEAQKVHARYDTNSLLVASIPR